MVALVWKTERKGSDVNLGVHFVRDALTAAFDEAVVLTNDTDLEEAVRIVAEDARLPVTLLIPVAAPATSLLNVATYVRHIKPYLAPCHFPDSMIGANGKLISKPTCRCIAPSVVGGRCGKACDDSAS